jgi:hypothetical protein
LLACLQLGINPNAKEMKEELCFYGNAGPTRTRSYWAQLQVGWPVLCVVATTRLDLQSQQLKNKKLDCKNMILMTYNGDHQPAKRSNLS